MAWLVSLENIAQSYYRRIYICMCILNVILAIPRSLGHYPCYSNLESSQLRSCTRFSYYWLLLLLLCCCCPETKFLDCSEPREGQCQYSILGSSTFAPLDHIKYQTHQSCISFIEQFSIMAPRNLLQDTVEYNRKINLTQKVLKSKKCSQSLLSLRST